NKCIQLVILVLDKSFIAHLEYLKGPSQVSVSKDLLKGIKTSSMSAPPKTKGLRNGHTKTREWTFRIHCETNPGETVCVTGNVAELGEWNHEKGVSLQLESDTIGGNEKLHIVRRWESHLTPRIISNNEYLVDPVAETFGAHDGAIKIEHGWLTSETVIQFKISNSPLQFWRKKYKNTPIRLKMVAMNISRQNTYTEAVESNSMDFLDSYSNSHWPITEIAVMNEDEYEMKLQEQFGRAYNEGEIVIFQAQVLELGSVAYMIDFYMDNPNTDIPSHVGFCHILPLNFKQSIGTTAVPITNMRQEPIGQITIEYLVIRPIPDCPCNLRISYSHHWKHTWTGLDVGHRGSGNSAKTFQACANLRENTIASLQQAAERGADFVEFDVQLSKDLVPVLFHDFYVNIGLEQKAKRGGELTTLTIPMKDLTLAQLHELKVYHMSETPGDDDHELSTDHDPFPTLQHALEVLNPHVGFNVEIKWTMQLKDGSWELENPIELNMYLDMVLKVVLQHAGFRKIVFSCFHPDICTMIRYKQNKYPVLIRYKQNKYPVLFLTQGVTVKYPEYNDPRTQNIPIAILYALSANILGLSIHTEDILRDPSQVQQVLSHGLIAFCWGEDNNNKSTIKYLKELGLNGIIYDRIEDHIGEKTNIFLVEDNEDLLSVNDF
ncbi:unnamed protein product, partial [Allacma fusca]